MTSGVAMTVLWKTIFSGDEQGYLNSLLLNLDFITEPIQWLQSPEYLMPIMMIVTLWGSMGVGFLAMLSGMLGINKELYEAGYIDGISNRFQEMVNITIPSMKNQMLFGAVMAITQAFGFGAVVTSLAGFPSVDYAAHTIMHHLSDYGGQRYDIGYSSAIAVILFLMMIGANMLVKRILSKIGN